MNIKLSKAVKIFIGDIKNYPLNLSEIKYTFRTLMNVAGFPCHFITADKINECDIFFGPESGTFNNIKLQILMMHTSNSMQMRPVKIRKENKNVYLDFKINDTADPILNNNSHQCLQIKNDIIFTSFYLLSGVEEKYLGRDKNDFHDLTDSFIYQNKLMHTPIINKYALHIRQLFSKTHKSLSTWPDGKKYAISLTHDVDYPEMIRIVEILRYLLQRKNRIKLSTIIDIIKGSENFWKFKDWIDFEKKYGMKSAFYFFAGQGNLLKYIFIAPDPLYNINKEIYQNMVRDIYNSDFEVGMHSGYLSYKSENKLRKEKDALEKYITKPIFGNRHHYWHINPENPSETAQLHQKIGLQYDSSIAYEKHSGFRYSICSPFHLYDKSNKSPIDILQLPPTLMDNQLFGYSKYSKFENYKDHIDSLLNSVKENEGHFIANFHVRVMNNTFFPEWRASYEYLLESIISNDDYYCDTPLNISKYWSEREKILDENSIDET